MPARASLAAVRKDKKTPRKPPFIAVQLLNKITRMNREGVKETIQVWNRHSTIIPAMIGHTIALHNGRDFVPVTINEGMVGFKLGDFVDAFGASVKATQVRAYDDRA